MDPTHEIGNNAHMLVLQLPVEQDIATASVATQYSVMLAPESSGTRYGKIHSQIEVPDAVHHPITAATVDVRTDGNCNYTATTGSNTQGYHNQTTNSMHATGSTQRIIIPQSHNSTYQTERFAAPISIVVPTKHTQSIINQGHNNLRPVTMQQPNHLRGYSVNSQRQQFESGIHGNNTPRAAYSPQPRYPQPQLPRYQTSCSMRPIAPPNMKRCIAGMGSPNRWTGVQTTPPSSIQLQNITQNISGTGSITSQDILQCQQIQFIDSRASGDLHTINQSKPGNVKLNKGQSLSSEAHASQALAFVNKLWGMVNENQEICRWDDTGIIVIIDMVLFELHILRMITDKAMNVVKSNSFEAFHKLLLSHGFKQVRGNNDDMFAALQLETILQVKPTLAAYYHPCFQRDRPDLIAKIKKVSFATSTFETRDLVLIHRGKDTVGFIPAEVVTKINSSPGSSKRRKTENRTKPVVTSKPKQSPEKDLAGLANDKKTDQVEQCEHVNTVVESACLKHTMKYQHLLDKNPRMVFLAHCVTKKGIIPVFATAASIGISDRHESAKQHAPGCLTQTNETKTGVVATGMPTSSNTDQKEKEETIKAMETNDTDTAAIMTKAHAGKIQTDELQTSSTYTQTDLSNNSSTNLTTGNLSSIAISLSGSPTSLSHSPIPVSDDSSLPSTRSWSLTTIQSDDEIEIEVEKQSPRHFVDALTTKFKISEKTQQSRRDELTTRSWTVGNIPDYMNPYVDIVKLNI